LRPLVALVALYALRPLEAYRSLVALRAGDAGRTLRTLRAGSAGNALRPLVALRSLGAGYLVPVCVSLVTYAQHGHRRAS